jgi:hypothetical protein
MDDLGAQKKKIAKLPKGAYLGLVRLNCETLIAKMLPAPTKVLEVTL